MTTTLASPSQVPALEPLTILTILASSLPTELGTEHSPQRYTVPCILSRRVEPAELTLIKGSVVTDRMAADGYPTPTISISDRRLLLHDTSLEELESGLAASLAAALRDVTATVLSDRAHRAESMADLKSREQTRLDGVRARADAIDFV